MKRPFFAMKREAMLVQIEIISNIFIPLIQIYDY